MGDRKIFSSNGCCNPAEDDGWYGCWVFFQPSLYLNFTLAHAKTQPIATQLCRLTERQGCVFFFPSVLPSCCGATAQSYVAFIKTRRGCSTTGRVYSANPRKNAELAGTWDLCTMQRTAPCPCSSSRAHTVTLPEKLPELILHSVHLCWAWGKWDTRKGSYDAAGFVLGHEGAALDLFNFSFKEHQ